MISHTVERLLSNSIFISKSNDIYGYTFQHGLPISVIISVLSEKEYDKYKINSHTFNGVQWHKIVCEPNKLHMLSKYYGLIYIIISDALQKGKNVIIHSSNTQIRAAQLLASYLMLKNKWSYQECLYFMQTIRPDIELLQENIQELQILENNISNYLYK